MVTQWLGIITLCSYSTVPLLIQMGTGRYYSATPFFLFIYESLALPHGLLARDP